MTAHPGAVLAWKYGKDVNAHKLENVRNLFFFFFSCKEQQNMAQAAKPDLNLKDHTVTREES